MSDPTAHGNDDAFPPAVDTGQARFRRPRSVTGASLRFRDAVPDDAKFILGLRLDETKSQYISPTNPDVEVQRRWLEDYSSDSGQVYFIIETERGEAVGTVRLYDQQGESFGWGSWILSSNAPKSSAVETTLLVYFFGIRCGFRAAHCDVAKVNDRLWRYHEGLGARRVGEDEENYHYKIDIDAMRAALDQYRRLIPNGIQIHF